MAPDGLLRLEAVSKIFPGGIVAYTHLSLPFGRTTSAYDFESGTVAGACRGTTSSIDFGIAAECGYARTPRPAAGNKPIRGGMQLLRTPRRDAVFRGKRG